MPYLDNFIDENYDHFEENMDYESMWSSSYGEERELAAAGKIYMDYTILAVGFITLGLVLAVDMLRSVVDKSARGHPFFETVLEGVYHELSILGIVEALIFILHTHMKSFDVNKEVVFAKIHFMLFFTAIFNAFMSIILAILAFRRSDKMWYQTEKIDVSNYMVIRKTFESVKSQINEKSSISLTDKTGTLTWLYLRLRYPGLMRQYDALHIQVRFHDFRVHFIKSNNLPKKFQVSDYLQRCELHVFQHLVHITTLSMLTLMGLTNLVYFAMGIVKMELKDKQAVGTYLSLIFVCSCVLFVVISLAMYYKMRSIFSKIIDMDLTTVHSNNGLKHHDSFHDEHEVTKESHQKKKFDQKRLFPGGDPHYVIDALQFMQFGYALAAAMLFVFWKYINVYYGSIGGEWFIVSMVVCYTAYVLIMAEVLPRYTLCTSLGQLVNKRHLHEALAQFKLEEACRKRNTPSRRYSKLQLGESSKSVAFGGSTKSITSKSGVESGKLTESMVSNENDDMDFEGSENSSTRSSAQMEKLFDLVGKSTEDLPDYSRESLKERRKNRMKALSDGVSSMRRIGTLGYSEAASSQVSETSADNKKTKSTGMVHSSSFNSLERVVNENNDGSGEEKKSTRLKKSLSGNSLTTLMEEIPARTVGPSEMSISKGRSDVAAVPNSRELAVAHKNNNYNDDDDDDDDDNDGNSVGSGGSNFGDLPDMHDRDYGHGEEHLPLDTRMRQFLTSSKYRLMSNVFGTMACFFQVAMRVESLLIKNKVVKDYENTWDYSPSLAFWLEIALLCTFIVVSVITFFLFQFQSTGKRRNDMVIASLADIVITSTCIGLLVWAETERCCPSGSKYCCKDFSSRYYGGVGNIEPFTSLIALRLFRFWFGRRVDGMLKNCQGRDESDGSSGGTDSDSHSHDSHDHHGESEDKGSAVELWQAAVGAHPDLVDKYGVFSSEILQAMLGIEVMEQVQVQMPNASGRSDSKPWPLGERSLKLTNEANESMTAEQVGNKTRAPPMKLVGRYSHLPAETQSVILAGKIGKAVKCTTNVQDISKHDVKINSPLEFRLDSKQNLKEMLEEGDAYLGDRFSFIDPNANLIRSMRRCEWKFPPLINEWTVVDAVITPSELVFFEVGNIDVTYGQVEDEVIQQMDTVKEALVATKGGRGLRLRDVAVGREVVGHFKLTDIDNVMVERREAVEGAEGVIAVETNPAKSEYWRDDDSNLQTRNVFGSGSQLSRNYRWGRVLEDRLRIHAKQQNFQYVRFFCDLEEAELLSAPDTETSKKADHTQHWCVTIARTVARARPGQLTNKPSRFGENGVDSIVAERMSFIEMVDRSEDNKSYMRKLSGGLSGRGNTTKSRTSRTKSIVADLEEGGGGEEPPTF